MPKSHLSEYETCQRLIQIGLIINEREEIQAWPKLLHHQLEEVLVLKYI